MVVQGFNSGGQVSPPPHREVAVWWGGGRACKALFPWRLDHLFSVAVKSTANLEFSLFQPFFVVNSSQKLEADNLQIFMGATKYLPDYLSQQQNRLDGTCKLQLNSHCSFSHVQPALQLSSRIHPVCFISGP